MFAELTWLGQWKVLIAKVRGYKERTLSHRRFRLEGPPIPCVDLFNKNEDKVYTLRRLFNETFTRNSYINFRAEI